LFVAVGVALFFLLVWLAAKGLDRRTIGFVGALPMGVRVSAILIAAQGRPA
jgi:hypothetical protein